MARNTNSTIIATTMATDAEAAIAKVAGVIERTGIALEVTGGVQVDARRPGGIVGGRQTLGMFAVELRRGAGLRVNDAWVALTSYGVSPAGLGSCWEDVPGVGATLAA